jgi:hypothetical protein
MQCEANRCPESIPPLKQNAKGTSDLNLNLNFHQYFFLLFQFHPLFKFIIYI